ncbi:6105_t:CDS:2, partial [Gigaspora margarita]
LLVIDALWHRNSIQIVATNLLSLAYAGIQLFQHIMLEGAGILNATYAPTNPIFSKDDSDAPKDYYEARMRPLESAIIGLISVFSVYLAFISYMLTKEFGWKIYKIYTADPQVRKALSNLMILQALIKIDVFFIGSFVLQLIPSQKLGYYSSVIEIALVSVFDPYEHTRGFLTFFLVTIFVLVLITVFYSIICFRNMMRGFYIFAVYGQSEKEAVGGSPSSSIDNLEPSKHITKKENAIRQHQILRRQQDDNAVL